MSSGSPPAFCTSSELHAGPPNDHFPFCLSLRQRSNPKDNKCDITEDEKSQQTFTFHLLQPQKCWGLNERNLALLLLKIVGFLHVALCLQWKYLSIMHNVQCINATLINWAHFSPSYNCHTRKKPKHLNLDGIIIY